MVVEGCLHLKEAGVVHCDLKPENILYTNNKRNEVKIIDLGSACSDLKTEKPFEYVCSRYYRAPEIVLTRAKYSFPVDMWSIGCIIAELFTGTPIFPASSAHELIELQSLIAGGFPDHLIHKYDFTKHYFRPSEEEEGVYNLIPCPKNKSQSYKQKCKSSIVKEVMKFKLQALHGIKSEELLQMSDP